MAIDQYTFLPGSLLPNRHEELEKYTRSHAEHAAHLLWISLVKCKGTLISLGKIPPDVEEGRQDNNCGDPQNQIVPPLMPWVQDLVNDINSTIKCTCVFEHPATTGCNLRTVDLKQLESILYKGIQTFMENYKSSLNKALQYVTCFFVRVWEHDAGEDCVYRNMQPKLWIFQYATDVIGPVQCPDLTNTLDNTSVVFKIDEWKVDAYRLHIVSSTNIKSGVQKYNVVKKRLVIPNGRMPSTYSLNTTYKCIGEIEWSVVKDEFNTGPKQNLPTRQIIYLWPFGIHPENTNLVVRVHRKGQNAGGEYMRTIRLD
jgi:hypothetical protein